MLALPASRIKCAILREKADAPEGGCRSSATCLARRRVSAFICRSFPMIKPLRDKQQPVAQTY
jgi:hypothetical protein